MWMFDNSKIFEKLSIEEKNQLEIFCQEKSLTEWEVLFKENDEANAMYILEEGEIEIYKNELWKKIILWKVKAEDILWEMAVFWDQWKRMACAKAIKKSVLIVILSFSIKEITTNHPELLSKIKEIIEIRNIQNKNK